MRRFGLHGRRRIDRRRRMAFILVVSGFVRALLWTGLGVLYLSGVSFTSSLFKSVAFVALISLYANAATDFGQGCASLAQLSAEDAHHDAESTRTALRVDTALLERDIAKLAELQPGPEASALQADICRRLTT